MTFGKANAFRDNGGFSAACRLMRRYLSPPALFLVASYLLLSALPFMPLLFGRPVAEPALLLAATLAGWAAIWALLKRPAWFHVLLLPSVLALPVEVYLQTYFG